MAHQGLCLLLLTGAVACLALPREHFRPQRQLYDFPYVPALPPQRFVVPPQALQDPYYYPVAGAYNVPSLKHVQYGPPQVQYGVFPAHPVPVSSDIRYAPALVASNGKQQVIFTPPGPHASLPSNVVVYRPNPQDESGNSEEGYVQSFLNFVNHYVWPQQPAEEKPSGAESPAPAESEKPEKLQAGSSAEKVDKKDEKKEVKKEDKEEENKQNSVAVEKPSPQRYVVVGEPQFFGRFSGIPQTIRQPQVPSVDKGAVSSYLLFRNFGPAPGEPQQDSDYPQNPTQVEYDFNQNSPGRAALQYQKLLAQVNQREVDDAASVVVEAANKDVSEDSAQQTETSAAENSESEKVDAEEETGPTIAQVKPSAIALAGPGGVAAASPVGTALVGPGGMALSSPSATAVAGPGGAAPGGLAISPTANKALKTYHLANKNFAAFLNQ